MYILLPRFRLRISVFCIPICALMIRLEGAFVFALMMLSAAVHELGHLIAVRRLGYGIRRIDLLPMGALIVLPEGINDRDEAVIALSGPMTSILISCLLFALFTLCGSVYALFGATVNITLGLFNLLPVRRLDGGKALCCLRAHRGKPTEPICSIASYLSRAVFFAFSLSCFLLSGNNLGVALLALALLLQL